jgi:hypothetical protein
MRTTSLHVLLRVFLVAGALFVADGLAQERAPVPAGAALDSARKAAQELYGKRFAQAKTAADKTAVAKEMIEAGDALPKGSVDQYVVWKIARDVATGAGDVTTALDATDKLAEGFDVAAAKTKAETLLAARRQVNRSTQHKALAEAAVKVLPALIEADDYESAASLVDAARSSAQSAREMSLLKTIAARADEIKSQQKASQGYRDALAVLETKPTDPAANLAAGSYLCFVKGDWEQGVPMLALGSDAPLQAVAAKELKGAESAEAQLALADEW